MIKQNRITQCSGRDGECQEYRRRLVLSIENRSAFTDGMPTLRFCDLLADRRAPLPQIHRPTRHGDETLDVLATRECCLLLNAYRQQAFLNEF